MVSTRRPPPDACQHDFAQAAAEQTFYLFPPNWLSDILSLLARPVAFLSALAYVAGLRESSWIQRLAAAPLILPAARLSRMTRKQGMAHLHVHSFANSAHVAALARVLGGCPFSLTLHGDLDGYGRDHVSKTKHALFLTCVSAPLKNQLLERLGDSSPAVHLLWMGVDVIRFAPKERPARLPGDPFRLLTVARLHANKGHRFALRAMKRQQDEGWKVVYTIVGDGPARDEIEQAIFSLGLADSVELAGTRGEAEVQALLQSSDALLLTSVGSEGAPVAIMEAMACGVPVVSSIIGGTQDMIEHGKDGFLVPQQNVEAIADSLRQLAENPQLALEMGRLARARAVREFDSRALANRFLQLITSTPESMD